MSGNITASGRQSLSDHAKSAARDSKQRFAEHTRMAPGGDLLGSWAPDDAELSSNSGAGCWKCDSGGGSALERTADIYGDDGAVIGYEWCCDSCGKYGEHTYPAATSKEPARVAGVDYAMFDDEDAFPPMGSLWGPPEPEGATRSSTGHESETPATVRDAHPEPRKAEEQAKTSGWKKLFGRG